MGSKSDNNFNLFMPLLGIIPNSVTDTYFRSKTFQYTVISEFKKFCRKTAAEEN